MPASIRKARCLSGFTRKMSDGGIAVKDSGIGIPADEMELIFQSFYRGSNTREYAGQGIGLSLSMKSFLSTGVRSAFVPKKGRGRK